MLEVNTMIFAKLENSWHIGITFSQLRNSASRLVILIVLLTEANLEPKNSSQLLLSVEIQFRQVGEFAMCQICFGTFPIPSTPHRGGVR